MHTVDADACISCLSTQYAGLRLVGPRSFVAFVPISVLNGMAHPVSVCLCCGVFFVFCWCVILLTPNIAAMLEGLASYLGPSAALCLHSFASV